MNYNEIVDNLVNNFVHPCDAEVPPGMYRRVMWEKYNPSHAMMQPAVGEEWDTEIVPIYKRLYDSNPFGHKSRPLGTDPIVPPTPPQVYSKRIGATFESQTKLEEYVVSIGSKMIGVDDWYGADVTKANLFKNPAELAMYRVENSGGTIALTGPTIDVRTMSAFSDSTQSFTAINFSGLDSGNKTKYLKHYTDKPCTYVGFAAVLPPDLGMPPIPPTTAPSVGALPVLVRGVSCIPVEASFPYTEVCKAVTDALGRTRKSLKAAFDALPGITIATQGEYFATMYDRLSSAAEEAYAGAAAISQYALQVALAEFKKVISTALNIVGGGWDLIKSFLPSISIAGINFDILEIVFSDNAVQSMTSKINDAIDKGKLKFDEAVDQIYAAIGETYQYAKSRVQMKYRDIVDAVSTMYDWMMAQMQSACVALCKLMGDLAQIWSIPPLLPGPNPVWIAIKAVREMFGQIEPLATIMSGNFPGFTAMDIYNQVMKIVDSEIEAARKILGALKEQLSGLKSQVTDKIKELNTLKNRYSQYLNGMWESVTEEATQVYQEKINSLSSTVDSIKAQVSSITQSIKEKASSISDQLKMGIEALKSLPIMAPINKFLGLCGMGIDDLMKIKDDAKTKASTLYEGFVGGIKSIKDYCYTLYNQISTLALSKVTQWVNKLLGIIGLNLAFPSISICVPVIEFH